MKESDMTPPCQEACCRHKHREAPEYDALIKRLNRIEGQVRGVRGMVEKEAYCTDILVQINDGDTIPAEKLARIFEQFYRLDASRSTRTGGAGLGLAIAKEIVELHGGTITATSANDAVAFTIFLPAAPSENRKNSERK